jgi:hypothetical protein
MDEFFNGLLSAEPNLTKLRTEMALPKLVKERIEHADPSLENERIDMLLPYSVKFKMER